MTGFIYGNGMIHSVTPNTRLLPARILDFGGGSTIIDQSYGYDAASNPARVTDAGNAQQNRTLSYDGLDRLSGMYSAFMNGQYNYSYDVLDNLRTSSHVGGSTSTGGYDARNHLI